MTEQPRPDWYLREWMDHFGKSQSDLVNDLGWLKGRVSKFYNGYHDYRRDIINDLAEWLGIVPFELLMPPQRALNIRGMQEQARKIAAQTEADRILPSTPGPRVIRRRTGTAG